MYRRHATRFLRKLHCVSDRNKRKKQFRRSPHIAHFQEVETISKRRGNSSRIFKQSHCARRNIFARSDGERSRKKERKREKARGALVRDRTVNKLFASRVLRRMSMSVVNKGVGTDAINGCERRCERLSSFGRCAREDSSLLLQLARTLATGSDRGTNVADVPVGVYHP